MIRDGKGGKDRQTILPESLRGPLNEHFKQIREIHDQDRANETAGVYVPEALERKYPNLGKEWIWFWVFPSHKLSIDPRTGIVRRHFKYPSGYQRAIKVAAQSTTIS